MSLKQNLSLKLGQKLILTPALKHQLAVILLPKLELEQTVKSELEENPFLEEVANLETPDDYTEKKDLAKYHPDDEDEVSSKYLVYKPTLLELLDFQIDLEFEGIDKNIAYEIVGNLDDKGYLSVPVEDIAKKLDVPVEKVENVRKKLMKLEPTGIGALNLEEFLNVQYEETFGKDDIAKRIITESLEKINDLEYLKRRYQDASEEEIKYIVSNIKTLNPYPLVNYHTEDINYIEPDVYIYDKGDGFEIIVNDTGIPRLLLTNQYKSLISRKDLSPEAKKFLEEKLQKAVGIIKGIEQRKENLYRIVESLVQYQSDFLRKGKQHLKPLRMKDIAKEVGLHESTVSRIVSNKFAQTPIGMIPLKSFFSTKVHSDNGGISKENVKFMIKELVENEDKSKPLSDDAISKILKEKGINVARRTVAKYREELNIPDSRLRRRKLWK